MKQGEERRPRGRNLRGIDAGHQRQRKRESGRERMQERRRRGTSASEYFKSNTRRRARSQNVWCVGLTLAL
eukprot:665449-Amorphochlora_amoeboformis.AAC.1